MKKIFILGSSGSIGVNSIDVIKNHSDLFKVSGLSVNTKIDVLLKQIKELNPEFVIVNDKEEGEKIKREGVSCRVYTGKDSLVKAAAEEDYDILVSALVGFAGLAPTIEAIKRGKRIALANKETLVVGGEFITALCKEYNAEMIPVDSEHSAIFQCLIGENQNNVEKLILTASGGPFLNKKKEDLKEVTIKEALDHPNWKMGNKITIDSASLMNKGLEVIEAYWLFKFAQEKIKVVIHPQSIIHSMVEFSDGSVKAQLGLPDMRLPIQYALTYPERLSNNFPKTDWFKMNALTFFEPDTDKFECLKLAYQVLKEGGTSACILNAANEIAVDKFLNGLIKFTDIPALIKKALDKISNHIIPDLETIFECDKITREYVYNLK
jgi:1-deoxy-D-xylulose-5-phosphate reductoisomerase